MAGRELGRRVRELAPDTRKGGDFLPSHQEQLERIDGRVSDDELPEFRDLDPDPETDPRNPVLKVEDWDDPEIVKRAEVVEEWREKQKDKPRRVIPGLVREEES